MTIEEAGEIILENKPFIDCINCDGTGWVVPWIRSLSKICPSCHGGKKQLLLEYEIACNVLGLEVP